MTELATVPARGYTGPPSDITTAGPTQRWLLDRNEARLQLVQAFSRK